jgi:hypothetical protein
MITIKAFALVKHIGWSHKKSTHNQNQPKSLPTPTHGQTEKMQQK